MEENEAVKTADQTNPSVTTEGYVSPEVQAAQDGEPVEFGKDLEENNSDN